MSTTAEDIFFTLVAIIAAFAVGAICFPVTTPTLPCVKCPTPPPPVICRACEVCTVNAGHLWLVSALAILTVLVVIAIACFWTHDEIRYRLWEASKYTPAELDLAARCNATYEQARFVLPLLKPEMVNDIGPTNFKFIYNDAKLKADQKRVREMLCLSVKEECVVES